VVFQVKGRLSRAETDRVIWKGGERKTETMDNPFERRQKKGDGEKENEGKEGIKNKLSAYSGESRYDLPAGAGIGGSKNSRRNVTQKGRDVYGVRGLCILRRGGREAKRMVSTRQNRKEIGVRLGPFEVNARPPTRNLGRSGFWKKSLEMEDYSEWGAVGFQKHPGLEKRGLTGIGANI